MADDSILKKVVKDLGQIGVETAKETVKEAGKLTESVITGQELFGVKVLSDEELARKKAEDERKVNEETSRILGRNVETEIDQVRREKKQIEEENEKQMLEQNQRQRELEETERQQMVEAPGNAKREAAKHQMSPGKRKKQQPDPTQMSQTSEFKGGKID